MNVKKAIAIGLLTITTITLTVLGVRFNLFNTQKTEQTNATEYLETVETNYYKIRYQQQYANYQNPQAEQNIKFYYTGTFEEDFETKNIKLTITLNKINYNNQETNIGDTHLPWQQTLEYQTGTYRPISIKLEQTHFILEEYTVGTTVTATFTYEIRNDGIYTTTTVLGFEKTTSNSFETIESNESAVIVDYDIYNNLTTIFNYGNTQQQNGYDEGYEAGLTAETNTAYQQGKQDGYAEGYNNSEAFNHPIGIQSLMLNILTMPFTFISKAFDVTLWPNTQYAFNLANFIKGLLAVSAILFIIKVFTSGFSVFGNFNSHKSNTKTNKPNKTKE